MGTWGPPPYVSSAMTRTTLAGCLGGAALLALTACGPGSPVTVAQADGAALVPADHGPVARGGDGGDGEDGRDSGDGEDGGDSGQGGDGGRGGDAQLGGGTPSCPDNPPYDPDAPAYDPDGPVWEPAPVDPPPRTIVAQRLAFHPRKLVVRPGTKVAFENCDITIHNVQTWPERKGPRITSPDARPGDTVRFKVPRKPGRYQVICVYHQSMTATIVVK